MLTCPGGKSGKLSSQALNILYKLRHIRVHKTNQIALNHLVQHWNYTNFDYTCKILSANLKTFSWSVKEPSV